MEKIQLSKEILNKLRCSVCDEYLSYGPISILANKGSVCGRCPYLVLDKNKPVLKNDIYEVLAKSLVLFPCRYHSLGCKSVLDMDNIPKHEDSCRFKPFFCPVMPLGHCAWQGQPQDIGNHFSDHHKELLLRTNNFEVDINNNYNSNMLMIHGRTFVLHKEFNNGTFSVGIYQINNYDDKQFEYYVEFTTKMREGQKKFISNEQKVCWFKHEKDLYNDCFKFNVRKFLETEFSQQITCAIIIADCGLQQNNKKLKLEQDESICI